MNVAPPARRIYAILEAPTRQELITLINVASADRWDICTDGYNGTCHPIQNDSTFVKDGPDIEVYWVLMEKWVKA